MIRFLICLAYPALLLPRYLDWSRGQTEAQIDKMQQAVFNTPGAEAPIPPQVIVGGMGLLTGYGMLARVLRLPGWQRVLAFILGVPVGVALYFRRQAARQ